jgi:hypothetical protein
MLVTCFGYTGYRNAKFGQRTFEAVFVPAIASMVVLLKRL